MALGKKNHVKLDPLAYNICLLGESKIGKTTLIYETCKKLAGEDGYIFAECGMEHGADAIEGINYVNCPQWDMPLDEDTNSVGFADLVDDIVQNKASEYPNLKVIVWDTYDQLINIAEEKSISLWNRQKATTDKKEKASSINAAWGGFGKGEKKAMELMFKAMADLRSVGVATIVIGHVKSKDVVDTVTGDTYQTLTSDQQQNYFNALKKNLHILGLAYIDRTIIKEKTGKKNPVTKQDEFVNKVSQESRKIKFRDDTYCVDSGGRFAAIVPEIDFNSDDFIKAIKNAILAEQSKSGKSLESTEKEQKAAQKKAEEKVATAEKERDTTKQIMSEVASMLRSADAPVRNSLNVGIQQICLAHELSSPLEIKSAKIAEEVKKYVDSTLGKK